MYRAEERKRVAVAETSDIELMKEGVDGAGLGDGGVRWGRVEVVESDGDC